MRVAVYLGSSFGKDPEYKNIAQEIGKWIGENGHSLVYGGSHPGLMGILADSALEHGAKVTGIIPTFFELKKEDKVLDLQVVETMSERKQRMMDLSDIAIALPGGTGTLEEIAEAISLTKIGQSRKECFLYNHKDFYGPLRDLFLKMIDQGFLKPEELDHVHFVESIEEIEECFEPNKNIS